MLALLMTLYLLIALVFFTAPAVVVADAQVYIHAVSPSKNGYAVDEAVTVNTKIKWEDLTVNKTIELVLWNNTDKLESLENYTIPYKLSGTLTPYGTYQTSHSARPLASGQPETDTKKLVDLVVGFGKKDREAQP